MSATKQLMLLRHAKSAWDDPSLTDHDRPLAPRGVRAGKQMGSFIAHQELWPDLVLCSSATRALDTFELVEQHWRKPAKHHTEVIIDRGLYLCGVEGFTERLRQVTADIQSVMIVAHNPDLHDIATALMHEAQRETPSMQRMRRKFPTAALAIANLSLTDWAQFDTDSDSEISLFQTPKTLAESAS